MKRKTLYQSRTLADDVPFYGAGEPIPEHRDLSAKNDTSGFLAVVQLLARSWPYVAPQVLGRWWILDEGIESRPAELIDGRGYSFVYMPVLATLLALAGPYLEFVPLSSQQPFNLLFTLTASMVICAWSVTFLTGKKQAVFLVAWVLSALLSNLVAIVLIEGVTHSVYVGSVTLACLLGWFVEVRFGQNGFSCRARVGTHLIYYGVLQLAKGLGFTVVTLLVAEIVNQSILQNEPLMPGLSAMIGYSEMSNITNETLSQEQRMDLRWAPINIELLWFLLLFLLEIAVLYYVIWIFQRINHDLRVAMVDRWHRLSLRHHADHQVGDSIWRIQSDAETVTFVLKVLLELSVMLVNIVSAVAFISILSPLVGFLALFALVPTLILARWAMPRFRTRALVERMANADLTSRVQESFRSIRLIKAYQNDKGSQRSFEADSMIAFNAEYRHTRLGFRVGVAIDIYSELIIFSCIFLTALWVRGSEPTYATELIAAAGLTFVVWNLSAFRWTTERVEEAIWSLGEVIHTWGWAQDVAMGLRRVFDILDMEPEVQDQENAEPFRTLEKEVQFSDVNFAYAPDRPVLNGVNLTANPGSITAIVGPSGAGKSTLMSLLLRLFDPDDGSITLDGRDLREFGVDSLRSNIAIALQENVLFGMSIRDNIRYAVPDADEDKVNVAVKVACLEETLESFPDGIDTQLGDRGSRLSTGQKQRLSIARAVVRDTPILILDEPTAALDAETEHQVLENLSNWATENQSCRPVIFLITHRISTIRQADNIVYVDEGRVLESGDHETLMTIENGRYRSFVTKHSDISETTD